MDWTGIHRGEGRIWDITSQTPEGASGAVIWRNAPKMNLRQLEVNFPANHAGDYFQGEGAPPRFAPLLADGSLSHT